LQSREERRRKGEKGDVTGRRRRRRRRRRQKNVGWMVGDEELEQSVQCPSITTPIERQKQTETGWVDLDKLLNH